ncbi:MAG: hypothetical protein IIZ93_00530 [Acidaminococcaceae bacterium]|nr:hypothetical protein [Acidaminococcaceae bacterium]
MDNTKAERVIFRKEKNPYGKDTPYYLAVFPDDEANPGRVCCLPFFFDGHGNAVYEPYCEASLNYYYKTHLVHRFDLETPKLLNAIQCYYQRPFRVMQKLPH